MALCINQIGYIEVIEGHTLPSNASDDEWESMSKSNPITIVFLGFGG
jgi:hypothetical protein